MKNFLLFCVISTFALPVFGESRSYAFLGGSLTSVQHNKSPRGFGLYALSGGFGVKINNQWTTEFEMRLPAEASVSQPRLCLDDNLDRQSCADRYEIQQNAFALLSQYRQRIYDVDLFVKGGLFFAQTEFSLTRDGLVTPDFVAKRYRTDEFSAILGAGATINRRHQIYTYLSAEYGNSRIGFFQFAGFQYNYLWGY